MEHSEDHEVCGLDLSEESRLSLLKRLLDEGQAHATNFMKAFVIYIGIHGILLKAWLDVEAMDDLYLRYIVCGAGLMVALLVAYVWPAWNSMRNALLKDFERLNATLYQPYREEQLLAMKFITGTSGRFAILTAVGWFTLFIFAPQGLTQG